MSFLDTISKKLIKQLTLPGKDSALREDLCRRDRFYYAAFEADDGVECLSTSRLGVHSHWALSVACSGVESQPSLFDRIRIKNVLRTPSFENGPR